MRDNFRLCEDLRMLAHNCDSCDGEKITLFAAPLSEMLRIAAETIEQQAEEADKSNEKIMFLLGRLIEGGK